MEDHRSLVGCPVHLRGRKEADVIVVPQELHHRIDEVQRRWCARFAVLGRHRHPSALGDGDELVRSYGAMHASEHSVRCHLEPFGQLFDRDEVLALCDQVVGEIGWSNRHTRTISKLAAVVSLGIM